jgi:hypothetical protein
MHKFVSAMFAIILVSGCVNVRQPIQEYRLFEQPVNQTLTASIGSTLVRMNRQGDLPNVYGGKDIYGGKVERGFVEVKLVGISGTELTLSVSDINRQSSETTMDRYVTRPAVNVSQTVNLSRSGQEGMLVKLDTKNEREYVVGGVKITFREVRNASVVYQIDDLMPLQNK